MLAPIIAAARSHRRPLYELAVGFLQELSARSAAAREEILTMARDKRSQVRFNAVICVGRRTPRDFAAKVIRLALADKSAKVREKAADWAQRISLVDVVPDLERALAVEPNARVKRVMEESIALVRDGYLLEEYGEGFSLWVNHERGTRGRLVSREEVEATGVAALVEELREKRV